MRTLNFTIALGGIAFGLSTQLGACNAVPDDCTSYGTCPDGTSGASGATGTSGSTGASGAGSGTAGTEGESGAPGGGSDPGGQAGKGGTTSGGGSSDGGSTGAAGDSGAAGAGGGVTPPCDTTQSPLDEACLVSDDFAVFVSPVGDDTSDGSQAAPFATLTKAVEAAAGAKRVLICDATYNEHVIIASGAQVYGGFRCTDWTAEAAKPLFKPSTAGPALKIDGVDDAVLVDGVSFEVGDAVAAGETALTAIVNQAAQVTLTRVSLKAGKGKAGTGGGLTPFTYPERSELDGNSANGPAGGAPKVVPCPGGTETSGGIGGTASPTGQPGGDGAPFLEAGKGKGGIPGSCATGLGGDGASAPNSPPASGAKVLGTLTALGWSSGSGGDGQIGGPGQGGGGGASSKSGGGGSGGAGACGGAGAKGGRGGGGSIALAILDSTLTIGASELITQDAGDGGSSVAGQVGDKDEGGFAGNGTPPACPGGSGGLGGDGGAGGGGAGGISVGIAWKGAMAPTVSADTTITNGKAGTKGIGGVPSTNDGVAGVSLKMLPLN